jgi:UV DNA damage endonuclease
MASKRKRSSVAAQSAPVNGSSMYANVEPELGSTVITPTSKRTTSRRSAVETNPDFNDEIVDGKAALRASPDAEDGVGALRLERVNGGSPEAQAKKQRKTPTKSSIAARKAAKEIQAFKAEQAAKKSVDSGLKNTENGDEAEQRPDPEADEATAAEDIDTIKKEAARPPPVNSGILPLPWKGRLGYVS